MTLFLGVISCFFTILEPFICKFSCVVLLRIDMWLCYSYIIHVCGNFVVAEKSVPLGESVALGVGFSLQEFQQRIESLFAISVGFPRDFRKCLTSQVDM